jgi:hypothetical protein
MGRVMALAAIILITGCAKVDNYIKDLNLNLGGPTTAPKITPHVGPRLSPAPLPRYVAGESFTYDDGRRETVLRTKGKTVTWRLNRRTTATTYRNFVIPRLSWESRSRQGRSQSSAKPGMLWPLRVGNDRRFNTTRIIQKKQSGKATGQNPTNESKRDWRCAVERTETITVPAGTFDTFRIACFRTRPDTYNWRQTRIYHYAPKLGHFVSRQDIYAGREGSRIQLTAAGFDSRALPRVQQRSLIRARNRALNKKRDNQRTTWRQGRLTVVLTPTRSYRNAKGQKCRAYTSTYQLGDRTRTNHRKVCRNAKGRWRTDK